MTYLLFSQRSVNYQHGTGAQLSYFLKQYPAEGVFNYGYRDPGYCDDAFHLESFWHHLWPFRNRGRGLLRRYSDQLPFSIWRNHRLTSRGRNSIDKVLKTITEPSHSVALIHDETCATRFNSIRSLLGLPYLVVLYDLMHLEEPCPKVFPELSACLADAVATYVISSPLRYAALELGSKNVKPISFYRPRCFTAYNNRDRSSKTNDFRILVMADAKDDSFVELLNAVEGLNQVDIGRKIKIHFVGNPRYLPSLCEGRDVEVIFYGFVTSSVRDRIVASCDIAYLAGSTKSSSECPLAKYSIPSKIGDFVAFGLPFIGRVSPDSAAYQQLNEDMSDFSFVATSCSEVWEAILLAARNPELCLKMSRSATLYADRNLYLPNPTTEELAFYFDRERLGYE
jgi:hypothetical protein